MSEDIPKLNVILGGGKKDATADTLRRAEAEFENWQKLYAFDAKRKKAQFDMLIDAGFTVEQALFLVK